MRQNTNYVLRRINKIPYLLPIGQLIAEHRKGVRLNQTGVYLWKLLSKERTLEDLLALCAEHYQASAAELETMRRDIQQFVDSLMNKGLLLVDKPHFTTRAPFYKCINIAGLSCTLYGPKEAFSEKLDLFTCPDTTTPAQIVELCPYRPFPSENGKLLLRSFELSVMECDNKFILFFPTMKQVEEVHISKNAAEVKIYYTPLHDEDFRENLFHVLRHTFLYLAQLHNMFALHSASILYKDKAWLFSGPAGTGKSTHTALWKEHIHTPILNGDLNLLAIEDNVPVIHGIPWCGTSGICTTETYPVGGIILLKQDTENSVAELPKDQKLLQVCNRLISPVWNAQQLDCNMDFASRFTRDILVKRLLCTKDIHAVEVIKQEMDLKC